MKLSDLYTKDTVARSIDSIAVVCTRTIDEMYPTPEMEFDTSILLCNGSTSEMLNNGAYGKNYTVYTENGTLQNGEQTTQITFLGCAIVRDWDSGNIINLTKRLVAKGDIYDITWDDVKNLRFVINVVSTNGISSSRYQKFDITTTSNIIYDFNSTFVEPSYQYNKQNLFLSSTGFVTNPLSLSGDNAKRIFSSEFYVNASTYNKYMEDSANIGKNQIGKIAFVYFINGNYFLLKSPISNPNSGFDHDTFTIDNIKYYLTISGFSDFDNGNSGFLPANDETKGAYPYTQTHSGSYKQSCNYYVSSNCAIYTLNSCGLRWVLTSNITTAKNFRDNVCLGKMDTNGIINHKEWITGETAIQSSDNPNKDTSYDNIPDRPTSGGDKDDDSDDINFGGSYAGLGAFAKFYLCSGLAVSELNSWINGRSPDWPENFDPMTQIISVSRFATDISSASYGSTTIKFHTAAGTEIDTKISALHGNGDNIELDLGSVNIPLRMKERGIPFLDYESTIELYIPACGTFILDPQTVLGSTLSVKMWLSTSTGECNSIAYVTRNGVKAPVAYGSGSLAVPMPVTSIGWGSYLAAVTNANIKYYFGGLNSMASELQWAGLGTGNQYAAASGLPGMMSSFQNMAQAEQNLAHLKNSSFTSVSGSFGSTAAWNYPFNAYVKITRRHFKKPSNYAHTRGIPLVETKTLSDCSGFTICVNADVTSINATIQEKNMIVEALNNGVIV